MICPDFCCWRQPHLPGGIDTGFVGAIPELDDADAALDLLRRLVSRKTLTPRMAEAMLAGLAARTGGQPCDALRQALESAATPPFPPNVPFEILWGAEDVIAVPQETTPMLGSSNQQAIFPTSRPRAW